MAKHFYPVIFHKEETGSYSVFVPDLPGCNTEGESLEEAYEMASDAIGLYLEGIGEEEYPLRSDPKDIAAEANEFVALIEFNKLVYDKKHNTKAVKKTLTIPAWLNERAEANHVNFSGVLQEALMHKLNVG